VYLIHYVIYKLNKFGQYITIFTPYQNPVSSLYFLAIIFTFTITRPCSINLWFRNIFLSTTEDEFRRLCGKIALDQNDTTLLIIHVAYKPYNRHRRTRDDAVELPWTFISPLSPNTSTWPGLQYFSIGTSLDQQYEKTNYISGRKYN
jgi:hypothetical protein